MTIPSQILDTNGNVQLSDAQVITYDSQANARLATKASPYIVTSSVSPPTFSAPKGTLCLSTAGSSVSTRAYINTNGTTGWAAITTAS